MAKQGRIHIIGAGLAGLAAAVRLRDYGDRLTVYESAPRAGGRCRSFHDGQIGTTIDNGNHLLLSGNRDALAYAREIGSVGRLSGPAEAEFRFVDLGGGQQWSVRPGLAPWWILDARRRVPDTRIGDYWSIVRLMRADDDATVADTVGRESALYRRFWEPLTLAILNTAPEQGSAKLMRAVLAETVVKGASACRPLIAATNLADVLVDPAIAVLQEAGVTVRMNARIAALAVGGDHVTAMEIEDDWKLVDRDDVVILAVPAWIAETLIPSLRVPPPGQPIVNIHYRLPAPPAGESPRIVGLVGALAQWVFLRGAVASVTISAAEAVVDLPAETLAARCWPEVSAALGLGAASQPPSRVIKERRATPDQTPAAVKARPDAVTALGNLLLAGDWTATGVPATIEGAVRSGFTAAALVRTRLGAPEIASARGAA